MTALGARFGSARGLLRMPARTRPSGRDKSRVTELTFAAAVAQWALLALAGLATWLVAFGLGFSALQEHHAQTVLYAKFRDDLAQATVSVGGAMPRGAPVTLLNAVDGGLHDLVVVEGTSSSQLRQGPGHYPGTPLPGQAGVTTIFGRGTTFGGPFGAITKLRPGDTITATTGQGVFTYVVEDVRRPGDPFPKALPVGGSQLTLVTSEGSGWRSVWAPSHAVYVDALLKDKTVPSASTVGLPSTDEAPMQGDTSGLYPLVLWMQLLALAIVGVVLGRSRWGVWQTWLVGTPVVIAALWGASNNIWLLLPNLF